MTAPKIAANSVETLRVRVTVESPPGTLIDPTDDSVEMGFTSDSADPEDADFLSATWETNENVTPNAYYASCVVGPDTFDAGTTYTVWVKIVDGSETPIKWCGTVEAI